MIVSTEQARTMWCPMVRSANGKEASNVAVNVPMLTHDFGPSRCKAQDCMMWRWSDRINEFGYCGLAGSIGA